MADILVGYFTASKQTNQITIADHGLLNGDTVRFALGAVGNTLPTPLVEDTYYFVVNSTSTTFQVSLTSFGGAVVLTDNGTGSNEAWSPAPTANVWNYGILITGSETAFKPDVKEVNYYAERGWELMSMAQIVATPTGVPGGFYYLMRKQGPPG